MVNLGQRLKEARVAAGLTQLELAVLAEIDTSQVSRIERGIQTPYSATVSSLARVLELDEAELEGLAVRTKKNSNA